jgi:hypothetical protein
MQKRKTGLFAAALTALMAMAMLAPMAQAKEPAPGYTQFKGCPTKTEFATVLVCTHTTITGGHFQMGTKDVPLTNPMTLTGGVAAGSIIVANAEGGLSPTKQKVPGGIIGLTGLTWLAEFLGIEALTLYAETQLVGQPTSTETLNLPIRVHLINAALGNNCYVGSPTNPIQLHLSTGTTSPPAPNKPISGSPPVGSLDVATGILHQNGGVFVDNSFSAPGASGCTLTLFGFIPISINGLVNSQSGLPAAAGTNETIQNFDVETVAVKRVYPPTGF